MEELSAAFREAEIDFVPFKGTCISEYYPDPALRTMGDMDLAIHTEDRQRSDKVMKRLGYVSMVDNHAVWTYQKDDRFCLKPEFHFLYLLAHTAKHIINKGYGIRGFLDLVFFVRGEPDMDWDWIEEQLRELRLLDFAKTCFALCQRWFDVELPLAGGMDLPLLVLSAP